MSSNNTDINIIDANTNTNHDMWRTQTPTTSRIMKLQLGEAEQPTTIRIMKHERNISSNIFFLPCFLAVQDSSIGYLVTH